MPPPQARRSLAVSTAAAFVLLAATATVLAGLIDVRVGAAQRAAVDADLGWLAGAAGLALCVPGAVLLSRMPRHPIAWILCIAGVHWAVDGAASSWLAYATALDPPLPGAELALWTYQRLGALLLLSLPLLLVLYPDGRWPRGPWGLAAIISLGSTALLPLALLVVPSDIAQAASGLPTPAPLAGLDRDLTTLYLPEALWSPLLRTAFAAVPLSLVVPAAIVVRRYRASTGDDRARMRWLVWAALVDLLVMLSTFVLPPAWGSAGLLVAIGVTGPAVAIGIIRPQLFQIERLLSGTLLYGALAACAIIVDVAVLGATGTFLGARLDERDAAIVALLVVMAVYGPLRHQLWRFIRRFFLGRRDDRYGVVAGLAEQLERSDGVEEQLVAVATTVAHAFRSSYVGVEVDGYGGRRIVAEHGRRPQDTQVLPISYRGEEVGRLVLPRGGPRGMLSVKDERLLGDVVRQAAAAARSGHLAQELQRSREGLVTAREEERRRLRRDLHDGLGPSLGGVALRIDAARNLAAAVPEQADRVLRQARDEVTAALADVRRLVHDLRPPALDDAGLIGALDLRAEPLRAGGLTVRIEDPGALGGLPAAIEVAAYRIASEALANVAKHAGATTCLVRLRVEGDGLVVEVVDDGAGIAPGTPAGVGLVSLRERAAELGGSCEVACPEAGGTAVRARLPFGTARQPQEVFAGD